MQIRIKREFRDFLKKEAIDKEMTMSRLLDKIVKEYATKKEV